MRDLEHATCAWVTKLPSVLWGLRTSTNRSTNFTPFFMVYGAKAVLPSDLLHNSPQVQLNLEAEAKVVRQDGLDFLKEEHELALKRSVVYQQNLRRYHSRQVR